MSQAGTTVAAVSPLLAFEERRRTADWIFRGALVFNVVLTAFWLFSVLTHRSSPFFQHYEVDRAAVLRVAQGVLMFNVLWGLIWYGVKALLLKYFAGFSKEERRQAFSSRMKEPFDV